MSASDDSNGRRQRPAVEAGPDWCADDDPSAGPGVASLADSLEEFIELVKAGKRPARDEFLARHGESAGALGDCLDGLELLMMAAPQLKLGSASGRHAHADEEPFAPAARLGDYRIVREV